MADTATTRDDPDPTTDLPATRLLVGHRSAGLIALAALAWLTGCAFVLAGAGDLARGAWYTPQMLAGAHLIGLGFITTTVVAAVLHLAPNMSGVRPPGGRWAGLMVWAGGMSLAVGLGADIAVAEGLGGVLLTGGIGWFAVGVAAMWLRRRGSWPEPMAGLALSALWLVGVLGLGLLALAARHGAMADLDRTRLIGAHLTMAALGFGGGLVIAVGTRMGPMVLIAPPRYLPLARTALGLWHTGVALLVLSFAAGDAAPGRAGAVLMAVAVVAFAVYLADAVRRRRRRPPVSVVHLLAGAVALLVAAGLAVGLAPADAAPIAMMLCLVGFVAGATAGHVLIMLPTMCWVARFGERRRTGEPRPQVSHLAPPALGVAEAVAFVAGVAALTAGMGIEHTGLATAGAAALLASAVLTVAGVAIAVARPYHPPAGRSRGLPILDERGTASR